MLRVLMSFLIILVLGYIFGSSIVSNIYVVIYWFFSLHWIQMLLIIAGMGTAVWLIDRLLFSPKK